MERAGSDFVIGLLATVKQSTLQGRKRALIESTAIIALEAKWRIRDGRVFDDATMTRLWNVAMAESAETRAGWLARVQEALGRPPERREQMALMEEQHG